MLYGIIKKLKMSHVVNSRVMSVLRKLRNGFHPGAPGELCSLQDINDCEREVGELWQEMRKSLAENKDRILQFVENDIFPACFHSGRRSTSLAVNVYICFCVLAKKDPALFHLPHQRKILVSFVTSVLELRGGIYRMERHLGSHLTCLKNLKCHHGLKTMDLLNYSITFLDINKFWRHMRRHFHIKNEP